MGCSRAVSLPGMDHHSYFFLGGVRMLAAVPFGAHKKRKLQQIERYRHARSFIRTIGAAHVEILSGIARSWPE